MHIQNPVKTRHLRCSFKTLHLRCLKGFWILLWKCLNSSPTMQWNALDDIWGCVYSDSLRNIIFLTFFKDFLFMIGTIAFWRTSKWLHGNLSKHHCPHGIFWWGCSTSRKSKSDVGSSRTRYRYLGTFLRNNHSPPVTRSFRNILGYRQVQLLKLGDYLTLSWRSSLSLVSIWKGPPSWKS